MNYAGKMPFGRFLVFRDANNKGLTGYPMLIGFPVWNKEAAPDSVSPTITIKIVVADGKAMADGIVNSRPSSDDLAAAVNVLEAIQAQLKAKEVKP